MRQPTDLYRYFDSSGVLLYVGISVSAVARMAQHRAAAGWWCSVTRIAIEKIASRKAALRAEKQAIRDERPVHNRAHSAAKALRRRYGKAPVGRPDITFDVWAETYMPLEGEAEKFAIEFIISISGAPPLPPTAEEKIAVDFYRDWLSDAKRPRNPLKWRTVSEHLQKCGACEAARCAARSGWIEYCNCFRLKRAARPYR